MKYSVKLWQALTPDTEDVLVRTVFGTYGECLDKSISLVDEALANHGMYWGPIEEEKETLFSTTYDGTGSVIEQFYKGVWSPYECRDRGDEHEPNKGGEKEAPKHATRHNEGKPDLSLLPAEALYQMAYVAMHGDEKYGRDNWRSLWGDKTVNVCNASLLRHAIAMNEGVLYDEESGLPHAAHIMMNCAFILEYLKQEKERK